MNRRPTRSLLFPRDPAVYLSPFWGTFWAEKNSNEMTAFGCPSWPRAVQRRDGRCAVCGWGSVLIDECKLVINGQTSSAPIYIFRGCSSQQMEYLWLFLKQTTYLALKVTNFKSRRLLSRKTKCLVNNMKYIFVNGQQQQTSGSKFFQPLAEAFSLALSQVRSLKAHVSRSAVGKKGKEDKMK